MTSLTSMWELCGFNSSAIMVCSFCCSCQQYYFVYACTHFLVCNDICPGRSCLKEALIVWLLLVADGCHCSVIRQCSNKATWLHRNKVSVETTPLAVPCVWKDNGAGHGIGMFLRNCFTVHAMPGWTKQPTWVNPSKKFSQEVTRSCGTCAI